MYSVYAILSLTSQQYRAWYVGLLMDEGPSHTARSSLPLARNMNMTFIYRPRSLSRH